MENLSFQIPASLENLLREVEQCPADFENYRQRAQLLRRLKYSSLTQMLENAGWADEQKREMLQKVQFFFNLEKKPSLQQSIILLKRLSRLK